MKYGFFLIIWSKNFTLAHKSIQVPNMVLHGTLHHPRRNIWHYRYRYSVLNQCITYCFGVSYKGTIKTSFIHNTAALNCIYSPVIYFKLLVYGAFRFKTSVFIFCIKFATYFINFVIKILTS